MNRYSWITALGLLGFLILLPLYALQEGQRIAIAMEEVRKQHIAEAAVVYMDNCVSCHGLYGEGIGDMPPLNSPYLADADPDALFQIIARSAHGSVMAAWHTNKGGILSDLQIEQLVTFIQNVNWNLVEALAGERQVEAYALVEMALEEEFLNVVVDDPHRCSACHEQPEVHKDRFGLDCVRCHTLQAWKPALLTRHTFHLDHGSDTTQQCVSCHIDSYDTHTCFGCHDHQPDAMLAVHLKANIYDIKACTSCHLTGEPGDWELVAPPAQKGTR